MMKMPLTHKGHVIERLPGFPDKPLCICIAHRCTWWRLNDFNAVGLDDVIKGEEADKPLFS